MSEDKSMQQISRENPDTNELIEQYPGKLAGMVVGCTGSVPYEKEFVEKTIIEESGTIGTEDIWQHNQIAVVGEIGFDRSYLEKSIEIGERFNFVCRYMSQPICSFLF